MSEQQAAPEASTDPTEGMSDDQLISGNELVESATSDFMNSTFNIPSEGGAPQAAEAKPTEDAFKPASEEDEGSVQVSPESVEMERREADLRRRERELDDHYDRIDEARERPPGFREDPWNSFQHWAKEQGVDPAQAYERLTANLLNEDKELLEQDRREDRWSATESRIQELEGRLQKQSYDREEQELWTGLDGRLQEMAEKWPIASARGNTSVGEVFTHILQHHEETGEVLDANAVFQQYEDGLRQQIQELVGHDAVRQLVGLAAKQQNQPQSVSAHEVVQGTPTLTNQSAGERSVLSSQDEMLDDDELIRLASEAFLGG